MSHNEDAAEIVSLRVGLPAEHGTPGAEDPMDRPWRTGYFKQEVSGPVFLGSTNLEGDGQADPRHHGGPDKALCVYPAGRYPYWRERLKRKLPYGAFGENLTVSLLDEETVCIGDVFRVGEATIEVSQPRSPCWKLARRWREKHLALWFQQTGFTGWYMRVLEEGHLSVGQQWVLQDRPFPEWTIQRANQVRYGRVRGVDDAPLAECGALAECAALGKSWRDKLLLAARGELEIDESKRLVGKNRIN